ncbi:putative ferric-chelate reductase 1 homolog [Physella acuta]|uniref:putative ferric-chelate reductase 1 homolog n=1 Tax=Physella acuta TaxID=109671 RepID=UPI0027DC5E45|nr:putative ferric-chelate reductase 1 homolog [Physella acuta]
MLQLIVFLLVLPEVSSYPNGAPVASCFTMMPKHSGTQSQLDRSFFQVTTSSNSYTPGQKIRVNVTTNNAMEFKGIQIRARRADLNSEEFIGTFDILGNTNKLTYVRCQDMPQSMVTHSNNSTVSYVLVDWSVNQNVGPIVFDVTVVKSYLYIYFGIKSAVINPAGTGPFVQPVVHASSVSPLVSPIDWGLCGKSKGCLLYPRYCTGGDCKAGVSFYVNGSTVNFELMAKADGYVSLGFSDDMIMGNDQTISCATLFDRVSIQHGFNHLQKYNSRELKNNLTLLEAAKINGRICCRFSRPVTMAMDVAVDESEDGATKKLTFNLNNKHYLFIAWGKVYTLTDVLGYHTEMPVISETEINFYDVTIYRGSVMPNLIRAHASLMATAWMGFAGLAIVIARFYKDGFQDKKFCGIKIWFHLHRISAFMTFALTVAGLVTVLVKLDGQITQNESAYNHMCLGFTVVALVCAQVLAGLLRPGPHQKLRPFFNFFHRFLGFTALVISAATIIYAYKISNFSYEMQTFGEKTMAVWAGAFTCLLILLTGYRYFAAKVIVGRSNSDEYNLDKMSNSPEPDESSPPSHILLAVFIAFILSSLTAALVMTIFF